ncbi:TPA: hypothetical protein ACQUHN_002470 [Bacillus thuringiensis]
MSFISIALTENRLSVVSDGMVSREENGDFREIQSDYKKFKKISEKQFIAFTGTLEICEKIADMYSYKEEGYDLSIISKEIQEILVHIPREFHRIQFAVGGVQDACVVAYTMLNDGEKPKDYKPVGGDLTLVRFPSNKLSEQIISQLFDTFVNFYRQTGNELEAQCLLNEFVADNDPTVNKNPQILEIEL